MEQQQPHDLGSEYAYELKYDGTQARIYHEAGKTALITKQGNDRTNRFKHIADELQAYLNGKEIKDAVLIGEIVISGQNQKCEFPFKAEDYGKTTLKVFDIKMKGTYDERRSFLEKLLMKGRHTNDELHHTQLAWKYVFFEEAWNRVTHYGLEGLIAKNRKAHFQPDSGIKMKLNEEKDEQLKTIENNTNGFSTLETTNGTRAVSYNKEQTAEMREALLQGKQVMITIELLKGTNRFPKYKKYEVKP